MNLNLGFKGKKGQSLVPTICRLDDLEYIANLKERIQ